MVIAGGLESLTGRTSDREMFYAHVNVNNHVKNKMFNNNNVVDPRVSLVLFYLEGGGGVGVFHI